MYYGYWADLAAGESRNERVQGQIDGLAVQFEDAVGNAHERRLWILSALNSSVTNGEVYINAYGNNTRPRVINSQPVP